MMARPIASQALEYKGQITPGRRIPDRWVQAPEGKTAVLIQERFASYVYHAGRDTTITGIQEWTSLAFPNGCSVKIINEATITGVPVRGKK